MTKKNSREKGKLKLRRMFQKLKPGDKVAIVGEPSLKAEFTKRMQGKVGIIESRRGKAYIVKIKDYNEEKKLIIQPIHLRRIN